MASELEDWVKDNWLRLREERGWDWAVVVKTAESRAAGDLAAWARGEAEKAGENITPDTAEPAPKRKG